MRAHCLADQDTVRGFALAGIAGTAVADAEATASALAAALAHPEIGLIIITDEAASRVRALVDAVRLERLRPLIVEIPGPRGPQAGGRNLQQQMQEAVGIDFEELAR